MAESCVIVPMVRNHNNNPVESNLFKGLDELFKRRDITKAFYVLGTNQEFLTAAKSSLKEKDFDENGEITTAAFMRVTGIKPERSQAIVDATNILLKGAKENKFSYKEAIERLKDFNSKKNNYNSLFLGTMTYDEGKYILSVVPRDGKEFETLKGILESSEKRNGILNLLAKKGVAVEMLNDKDARYQSIFDPSNADKNVNDLYTWIKVANNELINYNVAASAGHFAISAFRNSPLVKRLIEQLSSRSVRDDLIKEIEAELGLPERVFGDMNPVQLAGELVGRSLLESNKMPKRTGTISRLLYRVKKYISNFFKYRDKDNREVANVVAKAKMEAARIANEFKNKDDVDLNLVANSEASETSFGIPKKMYVERNFTKATYLELTNKLKSAMAVVEKFGRHDNELYDSLRDIYEMAIRNRKYSVITTGDGGVGDVLALEAIARATSRLANLMNDPNSLVAGLMNIDFENDTDFWNNFKTHSDNLYQVQALLSLMGSLRDNLVRGIAAGNKGGFIGLSDGSGGSKDKFIEISREGSVTPIRINLSQNLKALEDAFSNTTAIFAETRKNIMLKFLKNVYGDDFVRIVDTKVFRWSKAAKLSGANKDAKWHQLVVKVKGTDLSFEELLNTCVMDCSWFQTSFTSWSNSHDMLAKTFEIATRAAKAESQSAVNDDWRDLILLRKRFDNLTINGKKARMEDLFERWDDTDYAYVRNEDGSLRETGISNIREKKLKGMTGYLVSELKWGKWENDFKKFKAEEFRKFRQEISDEAWSMMTRAEKAIEWSRRFTVASNKWHKEHSTYDPETGRHLPKGKDKYGNILYENTEFKDMINNPENSEFRDWYNDYMNLKRELDSCLEDGATVTTRAPQFRGDLTNIIRIRQAGLKGVTEATMGVIKSRLTTAFCDNANDTDFGSIITYNTPEDNFFNDPFEFEMEKVHRIPVFGINLLPNMAELSTDIFHSTLMYSSMARDYRAMNNIASMGELLNDHIQKERMVEGVKEKDRLRGHSNASKRFSKFMDVEVYGITSTHHTIGKNKIVLEKIAAQITNFGSKFLLGGHVLGAVINTATGFNELAKEAVANEYFSFADFSVAHKNYLTSSFGNISNLRHFNIGFKEDKASLFIQSFDVRGDNERAYREWKTSDTKLGRLGIMRHDIMRNALLHAYSVGDRYMQSIGYMAMANKQKLYDSSGKEYSLYDSMMVMGHLGKKYREGTIEERKKLMNSSPIFMFGGVLTSDKDKARRKAEFIAINNDIARIQEAVKLDKVIDEGSFSEATKEAIRKSAGFNLKKNLSKSSYDELIKGLIEYSDKLISKEYRASELGMSNVFFKKQEGRKEYTALTALEDKLHSSDLIADNLSDTDIQWLTFLDLIDDRSEINSVLSDKKKLKNALFKIADYKKELTWTSYDKARFMMKARSVGNKMHGIYNSQDKVALQRTIMGSMWLSMKGYALGMIDRRFSPRYWNMLTGNDNEGSWVSYAKFLCNSTTTGLALASLIPFVSLITNNKTVNRWLREQGFSKNQISNLKRSNMDATFLLATAVISSLLSLEGLLSVIPGLEGDNDDESYNENKLFAEELNNMDPDEREELLAKIHNYSGILFYIMSRLNYEQAGLNILAPSMLWAEANSLVSLMPPGLSAIYEFCNIAYQGMGYYFNEKFRPETWGDEEYGYYDDDGTWNYYYDEDDYRNDNNFYYQQKSATHKKYDPKVVEMIQRKAPWYRSIITFKNGYDAESRWRFGTQILGRK